MAHKSKTQRAKASAARAARKAAREREESMAEVVETVAETPKKRLFGRSKEENAEKGASSAAAESSSSSSSSKKSSGTAKKKKKGFLSNVRSEMKRVTWPTRQDVLQWTGVVICALLFFGITVAVLDNLIITPALLGISGLA